jgi:hypothetical protein
MKMRLGVTLLVVMAMLTAMAAVASAETKTVTSNETNSFCINPFKSFSFSTSHEGPFPDTGAACSPSTTTHPTSIPIPVPGWANPPIAGTEWVGASSSGESVSGTSYYIYDATFALCGNQAAGASIAGEMYADNEGGAFLNGKSIGFQASPNDKHNFGSGPATAFGGTPPFHGGVNTLQIVVFDEGGKTGVDFTATVTTTVPCQHAEGGRCVKTAGGSPWSEKTCEVAAGETGGKYEWQPNCIKCGFKTKSKTTVISVPGAALTVECKKDAGTGKYLSTTKDEEEIVFSKCTSAGKPCASAGQPAGTIKTSVLESELGIITTTPQAVGLDLRPNTPGQPLAEFECETTKVKLGGSLIGQLTPFSLMSKTFTVTWAESSGKQNPEQFLGEAKDTVEASVNGGPSQAATVVGSEKITNEEKLEADIF